MDSIGILQKTAQYFDLAGDVTADDYCEVQKNARRKAIAQLESEIYTIDTFQLHLRNGHDWQIDERNHTTCGTCGWDGDI